MRLLILPAKTDYKRQCSSRKSSESRGLRPKVGRGKTPALSLTWVDPWSCQMTGLSVASCAKSENYDGTYPLVIVSLGLWLSLEKGWT